MSHDTVSGSFRPSHGLKQAVAHTGHIYITKGPHWRALQQGMACLLCIGYTLTHMQPSLFRAVMGA